MLRLRQSAVTLESSKCLLASTPTLFARATNIRQLKRQMSCHWKSVSAGTVLKTRAVPRKAGAIETAIMAAQVPGAGLPLVVHLILGRVAKETTNVDAMTVAAEVAAKSADAAAKFVKVATIIALPRVRL